MRISINIIADQNGNVMHNEMRHIRPDETVDAATQSAVSRAMENTPIAEWMSNESAPSCARGDFRVQVRVWK